MSSIGIISSKIVKFVARKAVGLTVDDNDLRRLTGSAIYPVMREAVKRVANEIVTTRNGLLRCNICGKGPFTRRGLYLHFIRVHRYDILGLLEEEYSRIAKLLYI